MFSVWDAKTGALRWDQREASLKDALFLPNGLRIVSSGGEVWLLRNPFELWDAEDRARSSGNPIRE